MIDFNSKDWHTPNTYDANYKYPENKSGVYLLAKLDADLETRKINYKILYVGSSKKLKQRYKNHEVLKMLNKKYDFIIFFFKECENEIVIEKQLIKSIQPEYNKIGK